MNVYGQFEIEELNPTDWFVWVAFFAALYWHAHGDKWLLSAKEEYVSSFFIVYGFMRHVALSSVADLYRHWVNFQDIKLFEWNDFLFFLGVNIKVDFLLPLLEFIFIKYGISFGFLRFLLVASTTMLFLNAYNSYCKSMKPNDRDRCVFLWFVIFIIPYAAVAVGLRSSFAASLVSYYIFRHYVLNEKRFIDIGLLLIAFFFHLVS